MIIYIIFFILLLRGTCNTRLARWKSFSILKASSVGFDSIPLAFSHIDRIKSLILSKNIEEAKHLLQTANSSDTGRSLIFTVAESCRRSHQWNCLVPLLQNIHHADEWHEKNVLSVLQTCAKESRLVVLREMLDLMMQNNAVMSPRSYSIFLKGFAAKKNWEVVEFVLKNMIKRDIAPDIVLLNTALDSLVRCGKRDIAAAVFDSIICSNHSFYEGLQSKDPLVSYFQKSSLSPDIYTFNTMLNCFSSHNLTRSFQTFQSMLDSGIEPDSVTINTILNACIKNKDFYRANEILQFQNYRQKIGIEGYQSVIHGLSKSGSSLHLAFELLKQMMKETTIQPNAYIFSSIFDGYIANRRHKMAKDILVDANTYFPTLSIASKVDMYNAYIVAQLTSFQKLSEESLEWKTSNSYTWQRLQNARYNCLLEAQLALWDMVKNNWHLKIGTVNALLSATTSGEKDSHVKNALHLISYLDDIYRQPDDVFYTTLFTALGKLGKADVALTLYRNISASYTLDTFAMNSLFTSLWKSKQPSAVLGLYFNMTSQWGDSSDSSSSRRMPTGVVDTSTTVDTKSLLQPDAQTFTILFLSIMELQRDRLASKQDKYRKDGGSFADASSQQVVLDDKNQQLQSSLFARQQEASATLLTPSSEKNPLLSLLLSLGPLQLDEMKPNRSKNKDGERSTQKEEVGWSYDVAGGRLYEFGGSSTTKSPVASILDTTGSLWDAILQRFVSYDNLIFFLYSEMRGKYKIKTDYYLLRVLDNLCGVNSKVNQRTSRFIFEDLIIQGYHPKDIPNILSSCEFSRLQVDEYLREETLTKMRTSRASHQIFNRHGWNRMESGWRPF